MALKPVLEYAYNLEFEEEPDYEKLKFMLKKMLLDENMNPINKFDWSFDHPKIADQSAASLLEVNRRFSPLADSANNNINHKKKSQPDPIRDAEIDGFSAELDEVPEEFVVNEEPGLNLA